MFGAAVAYSSAYRLERPLTWLDKTIIESPVSGEALVRHIQLEQRRHPAVNRQRQPKKRSARLRASIRSIARRDLAAVVPAAVGVCYDTTAGRRKLGTAGPALRRYFYGNSDCGCIERRLLSRIHNSLRVTEATIGSAGCQIGDSLQPTLGQREGIYLLISQSEIE
ncbi:hypothetical protein EVAR_51558_1 [Eumeta japonica]|uniref:Uncharacterized protein n=1 Tax=Eumeta variegata TaxID=151549 RepID=A0A4C1YGD0_EUMVA|nr:hypothetical protein EVAR_51558_1 [Eumeta japonica]